FPTVFELANASEENVLKLWQGLGYYSRARNLHATAKYVAFELNGIFPLNYNDLLKLKGIGDYTASAIASICHNEPVAVVDGNVYRVLARFFDIETPVNSTAGIKEFKSLAGQLLNEQDPGTYNQAIMEFGALQCTPQLPKCETCPLSTACLALKYKKVNLLPVKLKKAKVTKRYFNYLVFKSVENTTILEQRVGRGIWEGLYQFPLIETSEQLSPEEFTTLPEFVALIDIKQHPVTLYNDAPVIHKLSHQHIFTHFWIIEKESVSQNNIAVAKIQEYPVPVLIANFLKEYDFGD
ncbi:MAG TPA: NUDIX domain-containing protein, partial [Gillisia sp.]|nr:NUDIX domain-containing protein [Gillisia sp.]